jgi:hypothetical protein
MLFLLILVCAFGLFSLAASPPSSDPFADIGVVPKSSSANDRVPTSFVGFGSSSLSSPSPSPSPPSGRSDLSWGDDGFGPSSSPPLSQSTSDRSDRTSATTAAPSSVSIQRSRSETDDLDSFFTDPHAPKRKAAAHATSTVAIGKSKSEPDMGMIMHPFVDTLAYELCRYNDILMVYCAVLWCYCVVICRFLCRFRISSIN